MRFAAYLVLSIIVFLICGCGGGDSNKSAGDATWLLRVGETEVSLDEFQDLYDEALAKHKTEADSTAARKFLHELIDKKLFDQIAVDSLPWAPILEHRAHSYQENDLVDKLKHDVYGHFAEIDADELNRIYQELGSVQYHFIDAVFRKLGDATQQKLAVDEGADLRRIAEYFSPTSGGGSGFLTILEVHESVIRELKEMKVGEIRGPIEAGDGYHIIQLIETADISVMRDFESIKEILRTRLYQDRGGKALRKFNQFLLNKYEYLPVMENVYWMNDWLREETSALDRTPPETELIDGRRVANPNLSQQPPWLTNPFTEEEGRRLIVTTTTDTIRAIELLDELVTKPIVIWPTFETPDEIIQMAKNMVIGRIEGAEAWSRGYAETPEFIEKDKVRRQKIATRNFRTRFMQWRANITNDDVEAWYREKYGDTASVAIKRYAMLMMTDEDLANEAVRILKASRDIDEAIMEVRKIDASVFKVDSDGLVVKGTKTTNAIEEAILTLDEGEVTAPRKIGKRWAVGLVGKVRYEGAPPFEKIKNEIKSNLLREKVSMLLSTYLEERRAITRISVNESVFKQIIYPAADK